MSNLGESCYHDTTPTDVWGYTTTRGDTPPRMLVSGPALPALNAPIGAPSSPPPPPPVAEDREEESPLARREEAPLLAHHDEERCCCCCQEALLARRESLQPGLHINACYATNDSKAERDSTTDGFKHTRRTMMPSWKRC